ncbi:tyrosine-type recombinase/integrase [Endozoicomonas acroporae]|uniref:tyrosine-type recombinase/integrase n=1 Tax=Endozoicomonas acroporae TaxID=1701104 RepID=UPI000C76C2C6|nr:tyrosine-type recombinase/integrase [Endozoicomonas acroporae]
MAIDISKERQDKTIIYIASVRLRKKHPSFSRFERRRFTEKVRATEWASKREREFLNEFENILLGNPMPEPVEDVTLEEYINRLIKYVNRKGITDFKKNDWSCIKKWRKFPIAKIHSSNLTSQHFIKHFETRITVDGVTPATNHRDLAALTNALAWKDRIECPFNSEMLTDEFRKSIFKQKLTGKSRHRDYRPSENEFTLIYKYCLKRDHHPLSEIKYRHLMLFAVYSTFRLDEICNLTWSNFNHDTGRIIVEDRKDPNSKMGNTHNIKLPDECIEIINMQKRNPEEDRIFPFNSASVSNKFCEMTKNLGVPDVTFHSFRHDGISRWFEQGKTIPQVAHLSGHVNWNNLRRYTHLHETEVVDLLSICMKLEKEYKEQRIQELMDG